MKVPIPEEQYRPTPAEIRMKQSVDFIIGMMLRGELAGLGVAAIDYNGEHSCLYFNKEQDGVLGPAIQELRVMYEVNQNFRKLDNSPLHNKSYRSH